MSAELVPTNNEIAEATDRRAALERLNAAAESASTVEESRSIMVQAKAIAELLESIRAPYEETWLAGKASVVSARKVGRVLAETPNTRKGRGVRGRPGTAISPRGELRDALGIANATMQSLVRLGRASDPDFQRYIQNRERIPSVTGAVSTIMPQFKKTNKPLTNWKSRRRANAGVKTPQNPSLDTAYSCIVVGLGHLSASITKQPVRTRGDIGRAMDHLYAAEDLLKPYRGGYGS